MSSAPRSGTARRGRRDSHQLTSPSLGDGFVVGSDRSGGPVNGHLLPWIQALGGVAGSDDGGDGVLAGDEGGVRGEGAAVRDDGSGAGEQGGPRRGGRLRDQYVTVAECSEVLRAVHDADRAGGAARRCRGPEDHPLADLALSTGLLHGAVDHIPDQPRRAAEDQRCGQSALALPVLATFTHGGIEGFSLAGCAGPYFVAGAEEHVIGLVEGAGR